jgi:hypothetical protein
MATMGRYCKAYPLARFREFADWPADIVAGDLAEGDAKPPETAATSAATAEAAAIGGASGDASSDAASNDEEDSLDYLFLQENLVVTRDIFMDEQIVFERVTPEWEAFCRDTLSFAVPEDAIAANPR